MRDEAKSREQLISELITLRVELARLQDLDIAARRLDCAERLATGIAHNFNNILTPILGYAQLGAKSNPNDKKMRTFFDEISTAAERAADLTNMLLAFSGRQIRHPRQINLNAFVLNMEPNIKEITGKGVNVFMNLSSDLGPVKVDPKQMEQVFNCLAENSRDAMPKGGVVTVETSNVYLGADQSGHWPNALEGDHAMVGFSDTGIGMEDNVRNHAFEPFFSTHEPWDKAGLGLSVCYGIMSQNGGRIEIQSRPGEGCVVKLYLPHISTASQSIRTSEELEDEAEDAPTILVVESDPSIAELAYRVLREHGYRVVTAMTVDEAIEKGSDKSIVLVVASIVKPVDNTGEIESRIRSAFPECDFVHVVKNDPVIGAGTPRRFNATTLVRMVADALQVR